MNDTTNILIVGVGGQGVLLASEVISDAAMLAGLDVKKSEVHGMSQRGGVVSSHVRFGSKVWSPLIRYGSADFILSFEAAEGLRALDWLKIGGTLLTSLTRIVPPIASGGEFEYPSDPIGTARTRLPSVRALDADAVARGLGNARLVNTVMTGALSVILPVAEDCWIEAVKRRVPEKLLALNMAAFSAGRDHDFSVEARQAV